MSDNIKSQYVRVLARNVSFPKKHVLEVESLPSRFKKGTGRWKTRRYHVRAEIAGNGIRLFADSARHNVWGTSQGSKLCYAHLAGEVRRTFPDVSLFKRVPGMHKGAILYEPHAVESRPAPQERKARHAPSDRVSLQFPWAVLLTVLVLMLTLFLFGYWVGSTGG